MQLRLNTSYDIIIMHTNPSVNGKYCPFIGISCKEAKNMRPMTIHILPEDFRELPVYFRTASENYRQKTIRYDPGAQNFYQILFVVSGTGELHCDGKTYPLSRGCAFFTGVGQPSEYVDTGELVTAFLTFKGFAMEMLLDHYGCGSFLFVQGLNLEKYLSMIRDIIREYYEQKREGVLSAMTYRFVTDFFEQQSVSMPSPLEQLCRYMERQFAQKITLAQLAEEAGMSVSKLCHDFRREYGCTVFTYILDLRLTYARSYLRNSRQARTRDVAAACGFEDVSYFCKAYKKKFGITPAAEKQMKIEN